MPREQSAPPPPSPLPLPIPLPVPLPLPTTQALAMPPQPHELVAHWNKLAYIFIFRPFYSLFLCGTILA